MRCLAALLALVAIPVSAAAAEPVRDGLGFATSAQVEAQIVAMERDMKPGQGFAWRPLMRDGERVAAIEIWKRLGRPAIHPDQAEYAIVLDGEGTLISGGKMVNSSATRADLIEGDRIEGATTRRLARGDVMLIPAGVPHTFEITGKRLVLLGTKLPAD